MSAIIGESLLYEASRVMKEEHRLSYFQYRALTSFAEMLVLHDRALVIAGVETDSSFLETINSLMTEIKHESGFSFELVSYENRQTYVDNAVIHRFETICKEIYLGPLGLVTDQLLTKHPKDRTAEDMSERVEQLFCENHPTKDNRRFVDELLRIWSRNADSSELLYFFRAHLLQALGEVTDATPLYENQRLIAEILQRTYRTTERIGTLTFVVYNLVNGLFMRVCEGLPQEKSHYPRRSLLMNDIGAALDNRKAILPAILKLRSEFQPFREYYTNIDTKLHSDTTSLFDKADIKARLNETVNKVWVPSIASLGRTYSASRIGKFFKDVFSRYGIGDITIEHSEKLGSASDAEVTDTVNYAVPSVGGLITTTAQTAYSSYQEGKLDKPNRPLLECLQRVAKSTDALARLEANIPVHDFSYKLNQLLDRAVLDRLPEA